MSSDDLIEHVPPIARYRREPLAEHENALTCWQEAADALVPPDDEALVERLAAVDPETGRPGAFPAGKYGDRVARFLEENAMAIERLRAGLACRKVQFPEPDEEDSLPEDAESIAPLVELAQAWFVLARSRIAERDHAAAASELIQLGRMAHMICCGEGLTLHYLVGSAIMAMATSGFRLLAAEPKVPLRVLADLQAAVEKWLADSPDASECLRVELCLFALKEVDRLARCGRVEAMVDELLDRHYPDSPMVLSDHEGDFPDDGRRQWRRERILDLLYGHPSPWQTIATARLLGRQAADRILDFRHVRPLDLPAWWGRLVRAARRQFVASQIGLWPGQLQPIPLEWVGPGEAARRARSEIKEHSKSLWRQLQPPSDEALDRARRLLRTTANPLGILAAAAISPVEITASEHRRRQDLRATRAAILTAKP